MKQLLAILSFFVLSNLSAQPPAIQWEKTFGGNGDEIFYSMYKTFDSSIVITGYTSSSGGYIVNPHGHNDVWLLKMDLFGNMLWNKCFGGPYSEKGYSLNQTIDSGFVIAAYADGNGGDVSGIHNFSIDYWIIKTNSQGNIQWKKCYGGSGWEFASSIIQTSDTGYLIAGESNSSDFDVAPNHGNTDVWALKLNQDSTIQWSKSLGGSQSEGADGNESCIQLFDGNFLIVNDATSNNGDISGNHGGADVWVVKLNPAGQIIWQKCYGGSSLDNGFSIMQTSDYGFYVGGVTTSSNGDVTNSIGGGDFWLIKADSSGAILWEKCYGGIYLEQANSMCITADGGIALAGYSWGSSGQVSGVHGGKDYWVVKADSIGNLEWGKAIGGTQNDEANSILQTPDGGFLIAGSTESNDGDISVNLGGTDAWVVKLAPPGLRIPELENNLMDLYIFQTSGQINLRYFSKHNQNVQISIYDLDGRNVFVEEVYINEGINYHQISSTGLAMGMYYLKFDGRNFTQGQKLVIEN